MKILFSMLVLAFFFFFLFIFPTSPNRGHACPVRDEVFAVECDLPSAYKTYVLDSMASLLKIHENRACLYIILKSLSKQKKTKNIDLKAVQDYRIHRIESHPDKLELFNAKILLHKSCIYSAACDTSSC